MRRRQQITRRDFLRRSSAAAATIAAPLFLPRDVLGGATTPGANERIVLGIIGMGAHAFDMVQYALGADDTGPVEFWPVEQGPTARIHFKYASGVEVRLRFDDEPQGRGPQLGGIFVGADCKIEINRNKFVTNPPDFVQDRPDPALAEKWEGEGWICQGHVQNWFDCIKTRAKPTADVEIGHRTATVCQLLVITRQLGRRLRWDPQNEVFLGDDEANKLLDRPRRDGWKLPHLA
jgi:hypothetical protein